MKRKISKLLILFIVFTFNQCAGVGKFIRTEEIGGLSPSFGKIQNRPYKIIGKSEGMASSFDFLFFIPVTPKPDVNRAIDEMIQAKGGDDVIEVYYTYEQDIWLVGIVNKIRLYGKVIKYCDANEDCGRDTKF